MEISSDTRSDNTLAISSSKSSKKSRVCLISATFPPDLCGVGDYTSQLARALYRLGFDVTILTGEGRSEPDLAMRYDHFPVKRMIRKWNLLAISKLIGEIRSRGYNRVHIQYAPNFYGSLTFAINLLPWILRIYGIKTITTFHEIYAPSIDQWTQRMLAVYNHVKDTALLWGSAVSVLTVSQRRDRLAGRFPGLAGRLYAMPVGAGVQETPITDEESQTERQKLGVAPEEILLGSFGSMHVDRRYDTLFRALRALIDQGRRTRLALIGAYSPEHAYFRYLKKVIADLRLEPYIIWTGYGEAQTVSRWLALLDIYIMTDVRGASDRKSSLVSALAHGLPVISTRGEDTASHFVHGENILLFSVDDENELKNQIDRLLLNADERKHLGEEARCLYNVYYSWEGIAQQTIKAYGTDETGSEG